MFPWILCSILILLLLLLLIKIIRLRKGMDEICEEFQKCLSSDTNSLISLSSGDRHLRKFAEEINRQLRIFRKQQNKYLSGDASFKEAITNVSHDLRTPLTAISGYLELLENEEKTQTVHRYLSAIKNRTQAMKNLTEELFRYSVILSASEDLSVEKVSLHTVLEESFAGMYAAFKSRGITPQITLPEEPVFCRANKNALGRVINNILSNALKYSDGDLRVELFADGSILFSNTAKSLSEVQVGKLFDRFYTVESARNSHGLGLAIAKHLTEQMGGEIRAEYREAVLSIYVKFT